MDVDVTGGEQVLAWARVTEITGAAFTADSVQLSLTPASGVHTWTTPDMTEQVSAAVVRAALLVDTRWTPGTYRLWVQVMDFPEIDFIPAQSGRVVIT